MINWLTEELKNKVKSVFEKRYKQDMTDSEVVSIAENLTSLMEVVIKNYQKKHENQKN